METLSPVRHNFPAVAKKQKVVVLPRVRPDFRRTAVLLNYNARHVTDSLIRQLERIAGKEHVFVSKNLDDAEAFSREIVHRGYGTVVSGGGDGTLMRTVNLVHHYVDEANNWRAERYRRLGDAQPLVSCPRFAFLKLGTGNGMTQLVGANTPADDLERIVHYVPNRTASIPLIDWGEERFFFGGMGYDSLILDDYYYFKARAKNRLSKTLMQNVAGYCVATACRTLPRTLLGRYAKLEARVVTRGRTYYINPRRGDYVEEIEPGTVLWNGPASVLAVGTTPFYGYGFRMFPFARMMPGMMNLRLATVTPFDILPFHLHSTWKGSFRHATNLFDFLVEDIQVELAKPYPFQHSGDSQGLVSSLDLKISDESLELVDLQPPRRSN